jgi:hypothetical protein
MGIWCGPDHDEQSARGNDALPRLAHVPDGHGIELFPGVYKLPMSLPEAPLDRFKAETAKLPRTTEAERMVIQRIGQDVGEARDRGGIFGGGVARLVGIECGVVSGVINLESSGVEAPDWRPRHDEHYHEA